MGYASMYIQHKSAQVAGRGGAGDEGASEGGSAPYRHPAALRHRTHPAPPPAVGEAAAHGGNGKVEAWLGRTAAPPASADAEREEIERGMRRETQASFLSLSNPSTERGWSADISETDQRRRKEAEFKRVREEQEEHIRLQEALQRRKSELAKARLNVHSQASSRSAADGGGRGERSLKERDVSPPPSAAPSGHGASGAERGVDVDEERVLRAETKERQRRITEAKLKAQEEERLRIEDALQVGARMMARAQLEFSFLAPERTCGKPPARPGP